MGDKLTNEGQARALAAVPESQRAMVAAKIATLRGAGRPSLIASRDAINQTDAAKIENMRHGGNRSEQDATLHLAQKTRKQAADELNVSQRTVATAKQVLAKASPEDINAIKHGQKKADAQNKASASSADVSQGDAAKELGVSRASVTRAKTVLAGCVAA